MSGSQVSSFGNASQNALFDPLMARRQTQYDTNDLLSQQAVGAGDTEMAARIAQSLVTLGDDAKAAQLFPGLIAEAQSRGFLRHLTSPVWPGMERAKVVAAMAVPAKEQYERQGVANDAAAVSLGSRGTGGGAPGTATAGGPPVPPGAYGQGGRGSSITVPPEYMPFYQEASQRTGIPVEVLIAQHRQESGFDPKATGAAGEIGIGQIHPATAAKPGYGMTGVDPAALRDPRTNINFAADYLKARGGAGNWADPEHQRRALAAYNGGGDPNYVANVTRYMPAGYGGAPATQTAAAPGRAAPAAPMRVTTADPETGLPVLTGGAPVAPAAPAGGGGTQAPYQVASVTPNRATDATPAPVALPPAEAVKQAQASGQPVPIAGVGGLWALPNGEIRGVAPAASAQQPPATTQQPPPPPPPSRPAEMPAELRTNEAYLTPRDVDEFDSRRKNLRGKEQYQQWLTDIEQRKATNERRQREWQAQEHQRETAAAAMRKEQREIAAANQLEQSKGEDADHLRVLQAIGPKIRAGRELTPEETDQYDLHRRAYAEGPVQRVPDGKGGEITARVGREVSDRFPPLPGQKEYAGIKPIPGTEKQPDFAPQPVVAGMLLNGNGQAKIMKALASIEAHPDSVGAMALQPSWLSQRTDPAGVRVRSDIADVEGHILHELAGSAQGVAEAARLKPFLPGQTDTAEKIKSNLNRMLEINRESMLQSYRAYGPEVGGRRIPVVEEAILGSIPQASIDGLKNDPKRAGEFDKKYGRGSSKLVLQDG